jgi:hypothetical protein
MTILCLKVYLRNVFIFFPCYTCERRSTIMRNVLRIGIVLALVITGVVATTTIVSADPFLCPVVGDGNGKDLGVTNADARNGDHGVVAIHPPVGTSQLPGQNQAGAHANENAYNTKNPSDPTAGPGHNPEFSPIWPG